MEFPKPFIERIKEQIGAEADAFFNALAEEAPVSVRLNPAKTSAHLFKGEEQVPWCSTGIYLKQRPSFTLDPLFHAGAYYVQEASSMFLEEVFNQLNLRKHKLLALDACAAPGGKSTHIASLISHDSLIVSNETISSRASVLRENIIKWGTGNVVVTNNDPSSFSQLNGIFDVIVIDAPCSGEGLFRKDPDAVSEWSEDLCDLCATRQKRILNDLLPSLKTDGLLIYSTCTYNPGENEENIKWLIEEQEMECVPLNILAEWGITETKDKNSISYSFYPQRTRSEGFFISVLKKKKDEQSIKIHSKRKKVQPLPSSLQQNFSILKDLLINDKKDLFERENEVYLFPNDWINTIEFLFHSLKVKYAGTHIGTIKNDDLIPAHSFAMSTHLNKDSDYFIPFNFDESLKYLRKDDLKKEIGRKGWLLATYNEIPLGWIKSLGNRFNNYYPVEWRIRMRS